MSEFWHWPDHVIGKRESRRLREEHNARMNERRELLHVLEKALPQIKRYRMTDPNGETCENPVLEEALEAIETATKATL